MQRKILLMATILITASLVVPLFSTISDGADEFDYKYYISGYVITSDGEGNEPMEGVSVEIRSLVTTEALTDKNGYFKVGIVDNTNLEIGFFEDGYTLRSCPNVTVQKDSEYYSLDLTNVKFDTDTYILTSGPGGMQCALMMKSTGSVGGTISYEGGKVQGAEVKITSTSNPGIVYRTTTDSNGMYAISNCATGNYHVFVTCDGFGTSTENVVEISDEISIQNVTLIENNVNIYFGIDLAHVLTAIGIIVGIVLVAFAWAVIKRLKQNQDGITIVLDDLEDTDDDDEFKYRP